jgi:hypothetical protein
LDLLVPGELVLACVLPPKAKMISTTYADTFQSSTHSKDNKQRRKIQWKNWQEVNPWRLKLSTT